MGFELDRVSSFNLTRWRYGLHILVNGVVPPSVPMLHQTLLSSATFNTCPPIFTPSAIYPQTNALYSPFNSDKTIHIMPSITRLLKAITIVSEPIPDVEGSFPRFPNFARVQPFIWYWVVET